jgi:hypothetical protein
MLIATSHLCYSYSREVYWRGQHKCTSCNRNHLPQKTVQKNYSPRYSQHLIYTACLYYQCVFQTHSLKPFFRETGQGFVFRGKQQKKFFPHNLYFIWDLTLSQQWILRWLFGICRPVAGTLHSSKMFVPSEPPTYHHIPETITLIHFIIICECFHVFLKLCLMSNNRHVCPGTQSHLI